jgi:ethylbenzene dioxygenase beta subunit
MSTTTSDPDLAKSRAIAEELLTPWAKGAPVSDELLIGIERFLRTEARLLDQELYREWYALLTEDLFYWMPLRENRRRRTKGREISPENMAFFDERKTDIDIRIQRFESGMAWVEDPPTRHVYAISNVEGFETAIDGEFEVHSVFTMYRNRAEHDESTLMGRRRDILRRHGASFQIARRLILLQQSVLLTKNLSVFF